MKLIGCIKPFKKTSFTVPIYGDGQGLFYHSLDEYFRIVEFLPANINPEELKKFETQSEYYLEESGALVFFDREMNMHIGRPEDITKGFWKGFQLGSSDIDFIQEELKHSMNIRSLVPLKRTVEKVLKERRSQQKLVKNYWRKKRVLVVDDSIISSIYSLLRKTVGDLANLHHLHSVNESIQLLNLLRFDIVILNLKTREGEQHLYFEKFINSKKIPCISVVHNESGIRINAEGSVKTTYHLRYRSELDQTLIQILSKYGPKNPE